MAEQLFQIGIKGIIKNKEGKLLLLSVPTWGGNEQHWDLPGGRMDPGETFLQTLDRELQEEIGISYEGIPQLVTTILSNITIPVGDERVPLVLMVYEAQIDPGAKIRLSDEHLGYEWVSITEAKKRLIDKYPPEFTNSLQ